MPRLETSATFALALGLLSPALAASEGVPMVAQIENYSGMSSFYTVMRNGSALRIWYHMPLLNGDRLIVRNAPSPSNQDTVLVLSYVDGRNITLRGPADYAVKSSVSGWSRFTQYMLGLWRNITEEGDIVRGNAASRGACQPDRDMQLLIPGLADGTARIAAGPRHFMVQWIDGCGPYHIILRRVGVDATPQLDATIDTSLRLVIVGSHAIDFVPGRYEIILSDANRHSVSGRFTAVAQNIPTQLAVTGTPTERSLLETASLIERGDRTLYYEAYLRLYEGLQAHTTEQSDGENTPVMNLATWIAAGAPRH